MDENEDPVARKRRLARERKERWKARQSQGTLDRIRTEEAEAKHLKRQLETSEQSQARRAADAEAHQQNRQLGTPEQSQARRAANATSHQQRRQLETPSQSKARRAADASFHQQRRQLESPSQSEARRAASAEGQRLAQERRSHQIREEAIHFKENRVVVHNCGPMNEICE